MDLQSNPPKMYKNFDELIAEGENTKVPVRNTKIPEDKLLLKQEEENVNQ